MNRILAGLAVLALCTSTGCDQPSPQEPTKSSSLSLLGGTFSKGRLQDLAASNATVIGYLYSPDEPYIIASFNNGFLEIRTDPKNKAAVQAPANVFLWPDRSCIGFEQKSLLMPNHGPQSYQVCEALQRIEHSNSLPRSQDFRLEAGALFLMYLPPKGTGHTQFFYATRSK
jgi:hypothetical protein